MNSSKRRVVVTGIGIVSALGSNVKETWQRVLKGESNVSMIENTRMHKQACHFSSAIKQFVLPTSFKTRQLKRMDLFVQYGLCAAREAIFDANLLSSSFSFERVGVSIGSGLGGLDTLDQQNISLFKANAKVQHSECFISPFFIPNTIINTVSGVCAMEYGFKGPNFSVVSACSTGGHNIGLGARTIAYNDADVMVVGGTEYASALLSLKGFSACHALSTHNQAPQKASRPWDKKRDGFVLGDGAGVLVLEEYEQALKRGAYLYGEITGFGMSADAHDLVAPDPQGQGAALAMRNALKDANLTPKAIDYLNAHATSTWAGDIAEMHAIKQVFKEHVMTMKMSATKSITGHLLGAAGAIETIFCLLAIKEQVVPPTINIDQPDDFCYGLNVVPYHAQRGIIQHTLTNAFGFGGTNSSLILSKIC